ncbi:TetR family transcriptional regulator [Paraburkholderia sp. BL23I1N1]|uniref:TetR/AcrR family transcriptional regulator n=1 Tax=Paraburkholderia sp. BL23I1N1 TaxID=1938802 RepID=UPI000FF004FC|nr:TetR/AcrR family transcriptional regulator [Paraburkholderia sp. BL23I1N1]RKE26236.1 TetR family transcriptional regulator [Paraburkholderia sp. BL23I1N1]
MTATNMTGLRARKRQSMLERVASLAGDLFQRDGFESVTMEQIAQVADIARGTLYNHFPTKEAVLASWIHQELARDLQDFALGMNADVEFADGVPPLLDLSAQWCTAHRELLLPYLKFCFLDIQASITTNEGNGDGLVALYALMIRNSQHVGKIRSDLSAAHLATLFHHLYLGALMRWLALPDLELRHEFALAIDVFLQGSARTPG